MYDSVRSLALLAMAFAAVVVVTLGLGTVPISGTVVVDELQFPE